MTPEKVLSFLQANPDFLLDHPEVLPLQEGNVVNFQQAMVHKYRADKEHSENRQRMMVDNARTNMTVQARVHAAVLRVIEARNFEELLGIVNSEVALMMQVDVVNLVFEQPAAANLNPFPPSMPLVPQGVLDTLLQDQDSLLQANIEGDPRLFGPAARLVKSQAIMRLNVAQHVPEGVIVFGSRDPLLFADSQGTELAAFLADAVERILRHFTDAKA